MVRKITLFTLLAVLVATSAWATGFVNGGFESGDFTGWTKDGGYFYGSGSYNYTGDRGKSAIVTPGTDPITKGALQKVANGNYAARVNNEDWGYHFSTLSQTVNGYTDTNIYFAWAAVLEEPSNLHPEADAPHFRITLKDLTANEVLYDVGFNVYAPALGITWLKGLGPYEPGQPNDSGSQWWFNQWEVQNLDVTARSGHDFNLTVLASDCGWGGHGGYAYVDGFGSTPPPVPTPVPSAVFLLGSALVGLFGLRRKFK